MAPLREFDLAVKPHKESQPKLAHSAGAGATTAAVVTPTRTGSGSTPSPPIPTSTDRANSDPPAAAADTAAAVAVAEQAGGGTVVTAGADAVTGETGDQSGGTGALEGERPGLVALKGASFRWTNGREEDQHAKIFRGLMEVDEKKRKVRMMRRAWEGGRLFGLGRD